MTQVQMQLESPMLDQKIHWLEAEIAKLRSRAEKAELLVSLQKKVSEILGIALPDRNETS